MKSNKLIVFVAILLFATPLFAIKGTTNNNNDSIVYSPTDFGDSVSVVAGTTIKYTINALTLPPIEGVTIGDLTGNEIYIKVTAVQDGFAYDEATGPIIYYDAGLIFTNDVSFTIGEGFTAIDLLIPTGSATPAIGLRGAPHFNLTMYDEPCFFILDNGWALNKLILENFLGFDVLVDDTTELSVKFDNGTSSYAEMTWRKSDGVLTYLHIEDVILMDMLDFRDTEVEITYKEDQVKGLDLTIGDEILLNTEISYLNIDGTGEMYSMLNQTDIAEIESSFAEMEEQTMMKFEILDIEGLYYTANVYMYDLETQSLVLTGTSLFCGFLGGIQAVGPRPLYEGGVTTNVDVVAPVITTDYDIYTGYMILMDTIVGIYIDDLLAVITDLSSAGITMNSIDGDFEILEKKGYFFMKETMDVDMDFEGALTILPDQLTLNVDPSIGIHAIIAEEAWVAYSENGYLAGMRMIMDVDVEITTDYVTITGLPTGTISLDLDFKLVNPDFNPPDPIGGGIIPGFTWLISIPAILSIAAVGLIRRKK
ncbi:MAG: hypothetical protein FK730_13460 [Asgard group archaeon]|nr:hypothetical protein [Asgard group archaeon]